MRSSMRSRDGFSFWILSADVGRGTDLHVGVALHDLLDSSEREGLVFEVIVRVLGRVDGVLPELVDAVREGRGGSAFGRPSRVPAGESPVLARPARDLSRRERGSDPSQQLDVFAPVLAGSCGRVVEDRDVSREGRRTDNSLMVVSPEPFVR